MTLDPTTPSPDLVTRSARRAQPRRALLALVAIGLAVQVVVATVAFAEHRPARYGWQMYSAIPENPRAWSIHGREERDLAVRDLLVHARAEIDLPRLIRERGCELVEGDAVRFELADGSRETIECG